MFGYRFAMNIFTKLHPHCYLLCPSTYGAQIKQNIIALLWACFSFSSISCFTVQFCFWSSNICELIFWFGIYRLLLGISFGTCAFVQKVVRPMVSKLIFASSRSLCFCRGPDVSRPWPSRHLFRTSVRCHLKNRREQTCLHWPVDRNKHSCKTL